MVTTRLTYQDYANLEGDERYELLDGELILVAAPNEDHQTASLRMIVRMNAFVNENDLGRVFHAPYDVLFTDTDVVQPDVMFVSKERYHIRTPANIQGAPDLAVEILSPSSSRRDWHDKRELYARHGVREYWIIDPTNRIVSVLQLRDSVLEIEQTCTEGDTAESLVLGGFSVSLAELFQEQPSPAAPAEIVWVYPPPAASRQLAGLVPFPALQSAADALELWTRGWDSLSRGRGHVNTSRPTPSPWPQLP